MKSAVIKIVISLVFLVIFNVIFFLDGSSHSDANWCSYGFVTFAYLCLIATPLFARGSRSAILEGSLWLRAIFYFFTELIIAVVCMLIDPESMKWPLIIQGILTAIFIILQFMSVLANDSTVASMQKQQEESFSRQILIDQLQQTLRRNADTSIRPTVNRCLDALSNSPIQTFPEALDADLAVRNAVSQLCTEMDGGDISRVNTAASRLLNAIQDRNLIIRRCRIK